MDPYNLEVHDQAFKFKNLFLRSPNKDQKKKARQPSGNDSESDNLQLPVGAVLTISERVKLRQQMGLDLSNKSLLKQKDISKYQNNDNLEEKSTDQVTEDSTSQPSTSTKESLPAEREMVRNNESDDMDNKEDKTNNETKVIPKASITLRPFDNDDNEDTPSPSPESAIIEGQNLDNILTPQKAAENRPISEESTDKDREEDNNQTSNKQDNNYAKAVKPSPWKKRLSVSSENSDLHFGTLTPSKSRGILITIVNEILYFEIVVKISQQVCQN